MVSFPDRASGDDRFSEALETCRHFLLCVAQAEMPGHLTPKGGASDLVQEALSAAYFRRHQYRGQTLADLRSWLRGFLANELADFRRRHRASCRDAAREVSVAVAHDGLLLRDEPIHRLIRAERVQVVRVAVARLSPEAREVLVLRLELRLGFREIGDRLGRTEDAARKLFTRAVDRLRETVPHPTT